MNTNKIIYIVLLQLICANFVMGQEKRDYETDLFYSRVKYFEANPIPSGSIVYLGDSLIQNGKWDTYYGDKKPVNRGIIGNNTEGMQQILPEIIAAKPKQIFLIGGVNDISQDIPNKQVVANWEDMIDSIQMYSPSTQIFLHSVLPINNSFGRYKKLIGKEKQIVALNKELKKMAKSKGVTFVNIYPSYIDTKTKLLKPDFTTDGLHLTPEAYQIWADIDRKYIIN